MVQASDIQVGIPIVVVIGAQPPHSPTVTRHPKRFGNIGKAGFAIVAVKGILAAFLRFFKPGPIYPVDIQIAVAFGIQQCRAPTLGFDDIALFQTTARMGTGQAPRRRHVDKRALHICRG